MRGAVRFLVQAARRLAGAWLAAAGGAPAGREDAAGATAAPGLADELPDGPGVYRFFGEDNVLLYIGKSVRCERACWPLCREHRHAKEQVLARQVRRIDWRETAGELGALLLESAWVKQQKPLHNRRLRGAAMACTLQVGAGPEAPVRIVAVDALEHDSRTACYGLFRSHQDAGKALADIARAHQLCLKILGLERSAGSCFGYQVGKCRGACVGRETPALHSTRLQLALSALKLQDWPFRGRIALRERSWSGASDWHVLEPWAYLGTARSDEELEALALAPGPAAFDADIYRILVRQFAARRPLDWRDLGAWTEAPRAATGADSLEPP
jgi:DNA polymerase III subunit epsilon